MTTNKADLSDYIAFTMADVGFTEWLDVVDVADEDGGLVVHLSKDDGNLEDTWADIHIAVDDDDIVVDRVQFWIGGDDLSASEMSSVDAGFRELVNDAVSVLKHSLAEYDLDLAA